MIEAVCGPTQFVKIDDGSSVHVRTAAEWIELARRDLEAQRKSPMICAEATQSDAKDAERYRFLRDHTNPDDGLPYISRHCTNSWGKWFNTYDAGECADKEVDKAMQERATSKREGT